MNKEKITDGVTEAFNVFSLLSSLDRLTAIG